MNRFSCAARSSSHERGALFRVRMRNSSERSMYPREVHWPMYPPETHLRARRAHGVAPVRCPRGHGIVVKHENHPPLSLPGAVQCTLGRYIEPIFVRCVIIVARARGVIPRPNAEFVRTVNVPSGGTLTTVPSRDTFTCPPGAICSDRVVPVRFPREKWHRRGG